MKHIDKTLMTPALLCSALNQQADMVSKKLIFHSWGTDQHDHFFNFDFNLVHFYLQLNYAEQILG